MMEKYYIDWCGNDPEPLKDSQVYLSYPITGADENDQYVKALFWEELLLHEGFRRIFNPLRFAKAVGWPFDKPGEECMRVDLRVLIDGDTKVLCLVECEGEEYSDWHASKGCQCEKNVADNCGHAIIKIRKRE